jgi:hypothetical protein
MICLSASRAWRPAVAPRLDRRVGQRPLEASEGGFWYLVVARLNRFPLRAGNGGTPRKPPRPVLNEQAKVGRGGPTD